MSAAAKCLIWAPWLGSGGSFPYPAPKRMPGATWRPSARYMATRSSRGATPSGSPCRYAIHPYSSSWTREWNNAWRVVVGAPGELTNFDPRLSRTKGSRYCSAGFASTTSATARYRCTLPRGCLSAPRVASHRYQGACDFQLSSRYVRHAPDRYRLHSRRPREIRPPLRQLQA